MVTTVYALTSLDTNKAYIGYTCGKTAKRMREHRCLLRNGKHTSAALQADWSLYGETRFTLVILECKEDADSLEERRALEQKWLDEYAKRGLLYNAYEISHGIPKRVWRIGVRVAHDRPGQRWSEEVNLKRRLAQLGKPKGHGAKISATKRAKQAMR